MSALSEKLRAAPLRRETIECPILGTISVRELWADELAALSDKQKGRPSLEQMKLAVIACVEDPVTHELAFTDDDLPHINQWSIIKPVNDVLDRLLGIGKTAEEDRKN